MDNRTILVVDDDAALLRTLARTLASCFAQVVTAQTFAQAVERIRSGVDVIVTDVFLNGASGLDVAREAMRVAPKPIVIAVSGLAQPIDAFELGRTGVRSYLQKPFTAEDLLRTLEDLPEQPPPDVRDLVGKVKLSDVSEAVRVAMAEEAVAQTGGNKSGAARILGISRQNLQLILKRGSGGG